jgi:hypothetical protein
MGTCDCSVVIEPDVNANAGVVFVEWDEGDDTLMMPFLAIGPGVETNHTGTVKYSHSAILKVGRHDSRPSYPLHRLERKRPRGPVQVRTVP